MNYRFLVMIKNEQLISNKTIAKKINVDVCVVDSWIKDKKTIPEDKACLIEEYFGKQRSVLSSYKHSTSIITTYFFINIIGIILIMFFQFLNKLQINGGIFLIPFIFTSFLLEYLFYRKKISYILIPLFLTDLILLIYLFTSYPIISSV